MVNVLQPCQVSTIANTQLSSNSVSNVVAADNITLLLNEYFKNLLTAEVLLSTARKSMALMSRLFFFCFDDFNSYTRTSPKKG